MIRWLPLFILMFCSAAYGGQPSHLRIYISADMEGIGGVSSEKAQSSPGSADYEKFRRLMTGEVNAAISGAYDAGATEVLVSDSHWEGNNIDMELLDRRVKIVRGFPRPLGMMQGIDATFDAVVFIGYHASEEPKNAILAHMEDADKIAAVRLNGVAVPEAGFNAAIAGDYGVPVVFLSGDRATSEEAIHLLGPIETAVVKIGSGSYSGTMQHPEEAQRMIREGVRRGVERRLHLKPYRVAHPVRLEIAFKDTFYAEIVSYFRNVERPTANLIVYTANDMTDASRFFNAIGYLNDGCQP